MVAPQGTTSLGYSSETQVRPKRSFTIESLITPDEIEKSARHTKKTDDAHLRLVKSSSRQFLPSHPITSRNTAGLPFMQYPHASLGYDMPIHPLQLMMTPLGGGTQPNYSNQSMYPTIGVQQQQHCTEISRIGPAALRTV